MAAGSNDLTMRVQIAADVNGQQQVDALANAVDRLGTEAQQTGAQARASGESLDAAFRTLGIRSAARIEADILAVNQALIRLASSSRVSEQQFQRAFAAGQAQIQRFRTELNGATGPVDAVASRTDGLIGMLGKLGLAFSGAALVREFLAVNVALERMERTFVAVSGSTEKAAAEMAFARDAADRLGLPIITVGKAYADLAASTKGSRVEGQATRDVFMAVSQAMSVAGKTADDTQGALLALSQMASKGTVSMEELRGQLGERLPGALNAVAAGFGITTAQLIKLVESGSLATEQLFPALTKGLTNLYGAQSAAGQQTEILAQRWDRFKNSVADAFKMIGDAGVVDLLKDGLQTLEAAITSTTVGTVLLGKTVGTFLAALANGDIGMKGFSDRAKEAFAEIEKEAADKLLAAARHNKYLEEALSDTAKAALSASRAHGQAGAAIAQAGGSAGASEIAITRLNVRYGELEEKSEKAAKQAKISAEARKAETDASVSLATALGTEREQLIAKEAATRTNAEALRRLAAERAADLALSERHLASLRVEIATRGKASDAEQKQLDALQQLVAQKHAEADAAKGHAQSAAVEAAQAEVKAAAYADNSARVKELAEAYAKAKAEVEALTARQAENAALTPQLEEANTKAAAAGALYRDALNDQTAAIEHNAWVKQAQLTVEQAAIRLEIEHQRTIYEVARARGQEGLAIQTLLDMKRLEIKLAEAMARAKKLEADAAFAAVQAKREELIAAGELTAAKEAQLKAEEASAQVKKIEAEISAESASRMRELADAAVQAGNGAAAAGSQFRQASQDIDGMGDAAGRTKGKLDALKTSGRDGVVGNWSSSGGSGGGRGGKGSSGTFELWKNDKELAPDDLRALGMTGNEIADYYSLRHTSNADKANGLINRAVTTQATGHEEIARSMGLTGPAVKAFVAEFGDILNEEMAAVQNKLRGVSAISTEEYIAEYAGTFDRAKQRAKEAALASAQRDERAAAPQPASVHRVEITLAGKTTPIDTSSPDAAASLIGMLQDLSKRAA